MLYSCADQHLGPHTQAQFPIDRSGIRLNSKLFAQTVVRRAVIMWRELVKRANPSYIFQEDEDRTRCNRHVRQPSLAQHALDANTWAGGEAILLKMLGAQPRARTRNEILSPHQRQPLRQSLRVGKGKRMKANPIGTFVRMVCTSRSTTAHHREDNNTTCDEEQTRKIRCHRLFLTEID